MKDKQKINKKDLNSNRTLLFSLFFIIIILLIITFTTSIRLIDSRKKSIEYENKYELILERSEYLKEHSEELRMSIKSLRSENEILHHYRAEYKYATCDFNLRDLVDEISLLHDMDNELVYAVVMVESNGDKMARSRKGAMGLMQLMPYICREFGVKNPYHPAQNITGGVLYLQYLMSYYEGDLNLVLAAYNAGETQVEKHKGIPPFKETQNYIKKVKKIYKGPMRVNYKKIDNRTSKIIKNASYGI